MVLPAEHPWVKQAEAARKALQEKLSQDRKAEHAAEYRQTLNQLKKDYITAYIASHSKARLGVAEDKTRNALRKDDRLLALRVLGWCVADAHQPAHCLRGVAQRLSRAVPRWTSRP